MTPERQSERLVEALLVGLVVVDAALTLCVFAAPPLWFRVFHDAEYIDPQGLLLRTGAAWAAFLLFQLVALGRWREEPTWLAVVAGLRLGDLFTDLTYLAACSSLTWYGAALLAAAGPGNAVAAAVLFRAAKRLRATRTPSP